MHSPPAVRFPLPLLIAVLPLACDGYLGRAGGTPAGSAGAGAPGDVGPGVGSSTNGDSAAGAQRRGGEQSASDSGLVPAADAGPTPQRPADIESVIKQIDTTELKADLTQFASDALGGRHPGTPQDSRARDFIVGRLQSVGVSPGNSGSYLQTFSWGGNATANVIGVLPGNDAKLKEEVVLIGAHHDHLGKAGQKGCRGKGGSPVCNGADDNGSGTVGVIHVAQALSRLRRQNRRTLVFMTFGAEEKGLVGSAHYVDKQPLFPIAKTVFMINLDMIGRSTGGSVTAVGGDKIDRVAQWITDFGASYGLTPKLTYYGQANSDHYAFGKAKVPYVFFSTGLHDCYHATCDTADAIEYAGYASVIKLAARLMWKIAQGDYNPRSEYPVSAENAPPIDIGASDDIHPCGEHDHGEVI